MSVGDASRQNTLRMRIDSDISDLARGIVAHIGVVGRPARIPGFLERTVSRRPFVAVSLDLSLIAVNKQYVASIHEKQKLITLLSLSGGTYTSIACAQDVESLSGLRS